jgi:hypothetical protein
VVKKKIGIIIPGLLLGFSSCTNDDDCCILIDTDERIHYQTTTGENLLGSKEEFDASNIKIYYKNGREFELSGNSEICTNAWLNGVEMTNRFIEVQK